jgi:hypothetical protein
MMNIYYTGIGCKTTGQHTENEFLIIMNREFTHKIWNRYELVMYYYKFEFKDWILPDDFIFFSLTDWIEYSGAEIMDR